MMFLLASNSTKSESYFMMSDNDKFMVTGMVFLLLFSILGGMALSWDIMYVSYYIFIPLWTKSMIMMIILSASLFGFIVGNNKMSMFYSKKIMFFSNMWFMPLLFTMSSLKIILFNFKMAMNNSEASWVEMMIFQKNYYLLKKYSKYFNTSASNYLLGSSFLIFVLITLY